MIPHDVNYLDQRNKILGLKPQQLINSEQKGMRNKFLSWLLKDVDVDVLNVKHLEIYGKNTLTTPKIVLTDSVADPANDGEITRNGTTLKVKTEGVVSNISRALGTDVNGKADSSQSTTNSQSCNTKGSLSGYTVMASLGLTPTSAKNRVVLGVSLAFVRSSNITGFVKGMEGGVQVVAPVSLLISAGFNSQLISNVGILNDVSASLHTYTCQGKGSGGKVIGGSITGAVIILS